MRGVGVQAFAYNGAVGIVLVGGELAIGHDADPLGAIEIGLGDVGRVGDDFQTTGDLDDAVAQVVLIGRDRALCIGFAFQSINCVIRKAADLILGRVGGHAGGGTQGGDAGTGAVGIGALGPAGGLGAVAVKVIGVFGEVAFGVEGAYDLVARVIEDAIDLVGEVGAGKGDVLLEGGEGAGGA